MNRSRSPIIGRTPSARLLPVLRNLRRPPVPEPRVAGRPPVPRTRRRWRLPIRLLAVGAPSALALGSLTGCVAGATVHEGTLYVSGTLGADVIGLHLQAGNDTVLEVDFGRDGTAEHAIDRSTFTAIRVDATDGDDQIVLDTSDGSFTDTETTTVLGGNGADSIFGQVGAEVLDGGPGADVIDGNLGIDTLRGGEDDDTFVWDPGDANDVVDGGTGADHLRFSGAAPDEFYSVFPDGTTAVLFRNVSNVVIRLDAVESLAIRTMNGSDSVTIGDLSATAVRDIEVDLAGNAQVDDAALDEVVLPATAVLGRDGATPTANAFGTTVRVAHGSPGDASNGAPGDRFRLYGLDAQETVHIDGSSDPETASVTAAGTDVAVTGLTGSIYVVMSQIEHLELDLGGGDDSVFSAGNIASLVTLRLAGGSGADTILGSNGADVLDGGPGADLVDGNGGTDQLLGGADGDTFQWDPGDGSDLIDGGGGSDQMSMNGSAIGEKYEVQATGALVRLTRDIASISHVFTRIEGLKLTTVGGTDQVAVRDLSGSALTSVVVELGAPFATGPDATADTVTVDGTAVADTVGVTASADGSEVSVGGLPATVQIERPDPTLDRLVVAGLGGTDQLTATPGAAAAVLIDLLA